MVSGGAKLVRGDKIGPLEILRKNQLFINNYMYFNVTKNFPLKMNRYLLPVIIDLNTDPQILEYPCYP